ncbi:MAG: tRNA (adenosine(37)-N6)-threonylcarbamoyltransferase complex ATPase subunit type 1 TsaE [Slackia sp.]
MHFKSTSVEETRKLAFDMAQKAQPGDVILLTGPCAGDPLPGLRRLGMREVPTSPTFNLVCEYRDGRLPLYHFDLYRLEDAAELDDIDYYAIVEGDGVSLVEWGNKFEEAAPDDYLLLDFSVDEYGVREIEATAFGMRAQNFLS